MVKDVFRKIRRIIFMMNVEIESKAKQREMTIKNEIFFYQEIYANLMVKKLSFLTMVFFIFYALDSFNKLNC